MAIKFEPREELKKIAPKKTIKRLVKKDLSVNRAAITMLANSDMISKKKLELIALKVIKSYKEKFRDLRKSGESETKSLEEAVNDRRLIVARVQNAIVHEMTSEIKTKYRGEYYEWLPSDAAEPDPEHQLNYGKTFQIGVGEMPGDRPGCRCGMRILVDETKLAL